MPQEPPRAGSDIVVEYAAEAPVVVRGTASGRVYTFSPARRLRSVAAADAPELLRHPHFRRAAPPHR